MPRASGHSHRALLLTRNQWLAMFMAGAAVGLVPWIVFLGLTLPPHYDAGHWELLWIGFDAALVGVLAFTGWAAWTRRQIMAGTTLVLGVLLLCDAWFDIVTSLGHRDEWVSMLTGFAVELPLGLLCILMYRRIVLVTVATLFRQAGEPDPPRHLHDVEFIPMELVTPLHPVKVDPAAPRPSEPGHAPDAGPIPVPVLPATELGKTLP